MWQLIDFKTRYIDNGCDVDQQDFYRVKNEEGVTKWISTSEFISFKRLGLLKTNEE